PGPDWSLLGYPRGEASQMIPPTTPDCCHRANNHLPKPCPLAMPPLRHHHACRPMRRHRQRALRRQVPAFFLRVSAWLSGMLLRSARSVSSIRCSAAIARAVSGSEAASARKLLLLGGGHFAKQIAVKLFVRSLVHPFFSCGWALVAAGVRGVGFCSVIERIMVRSCARARDARILTASTDFPIISAISSKRYPL
ncbi:MAG: hypothetical protein UZ07_CHB004001136, partial [Chlorobi bacterium OLB7]